MGFFYSLGITLCASGKRQYRLYKFVYQSKSISVNACILLHSYLSLTSSIFSSIDSLVSVGNRLEFHLIGKDAQEHIELLRDDLEQVFGPENVNLERRTSKASSQRERALDPLDLATLILTIPPSILSTLELNKRLELYEQVQLLFNKLKKRFTGSSELKVKPPAGKLKALADVTPEEVLNGAEDTARPES